MEFRDYYKILGVEPDDDTKTIKAAYRKLARKYHPDVSKLENAEEKFKEVAEAYEVLSDTQKRAEFDEIRKYGAHGQRFEPPPGWQSGSQQHAQGRSQYSEFSGEDFSDFFSSIFGSAARGGHQGFERGQGSDQGFDQKGQDVETDMAVFLEDTLTDTTRSFTYRLPLRGSDGRLTESEKTLNVKIPAGVSDGERIRLKGQGLEGFGNGTRGDLYLRIRIAPHPLFVVEGQNLIVTVPLAPWEAALGAKIEVPTLDGKIRLSVPPNSQTGDRLRVSGKGLARKEAQGDLIAVLKVTMPESSSDASNALWEELARVSPFNPREEWSN